MNTYVANFKAKCPNNNDVDSYRIEVTQEGFMQVEDFCEYLKKYVDSKIFQEDLADAIQKDFSQACIKIIGTHQGVEIVSERFPNKEQGYELIISPKDTFENIKLKNVVFHFEQVRTLAVVFADNSTRNYPMQHIWYYEKK